MIRTLNSTLPLLAALGLAGCSSMASLYEREVKAELAKTEGISERAGSAGEDVDVITEETIAGLPEPVRRYFRFSGFIGKKAPGNARAVWRDFQLKRAHDKPWMSLECRQFNSVREPMRISLMSGRLMKVLPFEGRDKYQDGQGHMLVKAMGLFKVVDEKSRKMNESGLVTVLAEALLVPSYALQPYIRWETLDSSRAKAAISFQGARVEGIFHFLPSGECTRFETHSRWQQGNDSLPIPWSGYFSDYLERDGIRFASAMRAVWHEKTGDYEYAKGRIERMEFDVRQP